MRLFVISQELKKDAPQISLIPFMRKTLIIDITALAVSTIFVILIPKALLLVAFILAFSLDVVLILGIIHYLKSQAMSTGLIDKQILENSKTYNPKKDLPPFLKRPFILLITFGLLILAVMGPEGSEKTTHLRRVPLKVTIVQDLSRSMDSTDQQPTRLEAARDDLNLILKQSTGDEIGLVFFTSTAIIQAPQTLDFSTIQTFLRIAHTDTIKHQGTDLTAGLQAALKTFDEASDFYYQDTQYQTRRVLLVTDGEDHSGDLEATLDIYKQRNIHIDVIAMGSENGSQILDETGNPMIYNGNPVISRPNIPLLQHIASSTGGLFTNYTIPEQAGRKIIANWDTVRINTQPTGFTSSIYRVQLYPYFLYPAYILMIIFLLYPVLFQQYMRREMRREANAQQHQNATNPPRSLK